MCIHVIPFFSSDQKSKHSYFSKYFLNGKCYRLIGSIEYKNRNWKTYNFVRDITYFKKLLSLFSLTLALSKLFRK